MSEKKGKTTLLMYVKTIMLMVGVLPYQLINFNRNLYTLFRYAIQAFLLSFLMALWMAVPLQEKSIDSFLQSINILISYAIMISRGLVCITHNISALITDIVSYEKKIQESGEEVIQEIYQSVLKRSKMMQIFYITLTCISGLSFVAKSFEHILFSSEIKFNSTLEARASLPYQMKLPIDENEHYLIAVAVHNGCAILATFYYSFVHCILVILPLTITLRLKILNFEVKSIKSIRRESNTFLGERKQLEHVKIIIRKCIEEHINIIENCAALNNGINYLMLIEFLLSSAQMSVMLFSFTTTGDSNVKWFSLVFLFQNLVQLLILYWHANEIKEQSVALCDALYETDWYEYNKSINATLLIMMVRVQRPLSLTIGPFGEMSLTTAVKIIKAAYTYVMFMKHVYDEK